MTNDNAVRVGGVSADDVRRTVLAADPVRVAEWGRDFYGDSAEVDATINADPIGWVIDLLISGQGEPDSGCPQTVEGIAALFTD
jgi:hypothetical protein